MPAAAVCAAALAGLFGAMLWLGDLSASVVATITLVLAAGIVYFVALFALANSADRRGAFWLILTAGVLFRVLLFPVPPGLSEDVHRYRWEGRVQLAGWNPYSIQPDDPRLAALRDESWRRMPGHDIPTVYPPLLELTYRETARAAQAFSRTPSILLYKVPYVLADLLILGLLAWRIHRGGGRPMQLAIYAWNPLVLVEFAAGGHMDSLAVLALLAAVLLLEQNKRAASTIFLAAAALLKVFPLFLAPLWLRRTGWPRDARAWLGVGGALLLGLATWWPFRGAEVQLRESLSYLDVNWRFNNAGIYALLRWLNDSHEFAAGISAGVVAGLVLWMAARKLEPVRAVPLLAAAILLFSQNSFSWYFTWAVPFFCLVPLSRFALAWLLLTVTQILSYHVLINFTALGIWHFEPLYLALTYAPFFVLLFLPRMGKAMPGTAQ